MSYTGTGLAGQGSASLGGSFTIIEVDAQITTLGASTRLAGVGLTQRVYQAGWIGVGYAGYPTGFDEVDWEKFLTHKSQAWRIEPLHVYSDTFYWDLDPGVVIDAQVFW